MNYQIYVAREAEKLLDRLDRTAERRIRESISLLAEDAFDPRLSAALIERKSLRKSRVGDWRILFTVNQVAKVLYVLTADTRGQVYKHL